MLANTSTPGPMEGDAMGVTTNASLDWRMVTDEMFYYNRYIVYGFFIPAICIFGMVTNIINFVVFMKIGFKETVNISLLALTIADFCNFPPIMWFGVALIPFWEELDLPFDQFTIIYLTGGWPKFAFSRLTGVITVFITFERCICVMLPLKVKSIITHRRVVIFQIAAAVLTLGALTPVYMLHGHGWVYHPDRNRTLLSLVIKTQRVEFEQIYFPFLGMIFPLLTFLTVTVLTVLLVTTLKRNAAWRKSIATSNKSSDISSKERKVSNLVVTISTFFIVCFFPVICAMFIMVQDPEFSIVGTRYRAFFFVWSFFLFVECINSSMNIFIYYYRSTSYREMFNQLFRRKPANTK